jgi:hypothetical protein
MLPPDDEGRSWWTAGGRGELAGILQAPRAREAAPEPLRTKSQLLPEEEKEPRAKTRAAGGARRVPSRGRAAGVRPAAQPKPRAAGGARARDSGAG